MGFVFTPENLLENLNKLGPWSSYGFAVEALQYYFPEEYDDNDSCYAEKEVELLNKLGCIFWQDLIIKYHTEVGYKAPEGGWDPGHVNEY